MLLWLLLLLFCSWLLFFFFSHNLFFFLLLSIQYQYKLVAYLYYWSILWEGLSASINFLLITLFISCLNFSTKAFFLYSLSLAALLISCTNFFMVLELYSTFFSFAIFADLLSFSPNFFFNSSKNSLVVTNSIFSTSKSSSIFFFQISANSFYTYVEIHYTYSSTDSSLILILI